MMEYPSKRQKVSRIQRRAYEFLYRNRLQDDHKDLRDDKLPTPTTLFPRSVVELREPLLVREKRGGPKRLDDKHRMLHHRATVTQQDTVLETVVAQVDGNGSTVAVQTFPSVPTVPPFPSDLTVPAVPQVSSVSLPVVPSYPFGSSATTTGTFQATATVGNNSTITSTSSISSLSSIAPNATLASFNTLSSPFPSSRSATQSRGTASNAASTTASTGNGGGGGAFGTAASPGASSSPTSSASSGSGGNSGPGPSTSTVVGGVFGGLAGVALILALALLLLRWYKQKHRSPAMERIEEDPFADPPTERSISGPSAPLAGGGGGAAAAATAANSRPSMSQRRSFLPAAAAGFINRFSSGSKESDYSSGLGSPTQERGFQKISGRKLPSAFSEGITEADVASRRSMLSDGSFYRNSHGFSSVTGMDAAGPSIAAHEKETLMPSPARTPVVHQPFTLSATPPPRPATQDSFVHPNLRPGTLGRSHPSQDGSRGSRFTEEVI